MILGREWKEGRVQEMEVSDIAQVMLYLVQYCAPAAFVINLTAYGVKVIIGAVTGKGVSL